MPPPEAVAAWSWPLGFGSVNAAYVLLGSVALGAAAGMIGCFAFLRRQSLIGDALAHAALPGVCMAFLLTGTRNPGVILLGAVISCWAGALSIEWIVRYTRCKADSALAMVLSVYFGVGMLLLTHIQQSGNAAQAGLDSFLFGQAASLLGGDVAAIGGVSLALCGAVALGYKEFKAVCFDPEFAGAIGLPRRWIELGLATLVVLAVAAGLQAVGVVLMAALLVTPAAAARYWTNRLGVMLVLAAAFGAFGGAAGVYVSALQPRMPTGPWIVVMITAIFACSLLLAPERGVLPRYLRRARFRARTRRENVLRSMYVLGERRPEARPYLTPGEVLTHRSMTPGRLRRTLGELKGRGFVSERTDGQVALTAAGDRRAARLTRLHRLWELYLTRKLELAPDHVHDDAEEVEHIITPELEARLAAALDFPEEDPHQRRIPTPAAEAPDARDDGGAEGGPAG